MIDWARAENWRPANETRPRVYHEDAGVVNILRGINFNPGSQPEDMIALQIWAEKNRVITLRRRRLQTPRDILAKLVESGDGPRTAGDLVMALTVALLAVIAGPEFLLFKLMKWI